MPMRLLATLPSFFFPSLSLSLLLQFIFWFSLSLSANSKLKTPFFLRMVNFAPYTVPLHRRLQTLAVAWHVFSIPTLLCTFLLCCAFPPFWPLLIIYGVSILIMSA